MNFKSISDIFERRIFRIPDYQRGYAWRSDADKEVVAFWNDLMNLAKGKSHFTGSLILQSASNEEKEKFNTKWLFQINYTPWIVVDGQQRLTTIIIFLQCIYEFLNHKDFEDKFFMGDEVKEFLKTMRKQFICRENKPTFEISYLFGYLNNPDSNNFLLKHVFGDKVAVVGKESYYTLNIQNAKKFFTDNIKELFENSNSNLEAIEDLYRKVTISLKFDLIEVNPSDDFNIFVAFETINNRGKRLSNLEKLKNRLIYLTTLYFDSNGSGNSIRDVINVSWAEIYHQLGRNYKSSNGKVSVLDDDEFLRTHWILYYQYSRKTGNDYIDYLLGKKFTVQNVRKNMVTTETSQELVIDTDDNEVDEEPTLVNNDQESSLSAQDIKDYVLDLRDTAEMWYYTWFPNDAVKVLDRDEIAWMERIQRLGIAYFRPLITAIFCKRNSGKITKEKCIEILNAIERFIFVVFRLQTTRSNYGSSEFNNVAHALHIGNKSVEDVLNMINARINRSFDANNYFNIQYMEVMVKKLFEQKEDERAGYYRWPAIRYFLYEYNDNLMTRYYHGLGKLDWDSFKQSEKDKISIEHIFPHKSSGYWADMFKDIDESMWPIYKGSLGNLLLLSQKINAELQNDDFNTKKNGREGNPRPGYFNGSAAEREVCKYENWTPESIRETGIKMLDFMCERWGIKFRSEEDKLKLLFPGIDFSSSTESTEVTNSNNEP